MHHFPKPIADNVTDNKKYFFKQVEKKDQDNDDDYFMPVDQISVWKPMGIQPIIDLADDEEEQETSLQKIEGVENEQAVEPGEEAGEKEEEPEEERPFEPQAERPDEPQTELYAPSSEPNSVEVVE